MGRLADMLPNSWFYKHKEKNMPARTSSSTTTHTDTTQSPPPPSPPPLPPPKEQHPINYGRPSYYIPSNDEHRPMLSGSPLHPKASDTKFLVNPPRKSKKKPRKIHVNRPPPSKPLAPSFSRNNESATFDLDSTPILDLPPILTRPKEREEAEEPKSPEEGSSGGGGHGIRVGANSPGLEGERVQPCRSGRSGGSGTRKGRLAGSFPLMKSSANPHKDFRESMVEMIVENGITSAEEMEELLACYLSLNSNQYHDVIVEVFEQIWFELTGVRL